MFIPAPPAVLLGLAALAVLAPAASAADPKPSEREAMYQRYLDFASLVKGGSVTPHWMADGSSFWYAEGAPDKMVIYKVDPQANTKTPLFDTARLRRALTPVLGHEPPYQGLPFDDFTFVDPTEKAVKFNVENREFVLQLDSYAITRVPALNEEEKSRRVAQVLGVSVFEGSILREEISPDGRWFAGIKEYNLYLRSTYDGRSVPITADGVKEHEWDARWTGLWRWSPDSSKLALNKVDVRKVPRIPIVHYLKRTEAVDWVPYPKAGEPRPQRELFIVDVFSKRRVRVDTGDVPDPQIEILGWRPDGSELLLFRTDLYWQHPEVLAANPETGATRVVLAEADEREFWSKQFTLLADGKRFLWRSFKRGGGSHLYLYDLGGRLIRRLTERELPPGRVVAVDEKAGWVYLTGGGDRQRPYDRHLYRVNLEGKEFTRLTEATGQHQIQFAPSRQFFLDTHSTLDRPPAVELRRADGTLLRKLAEANIEALKDLQWSPPEEFTVKSADGKRDQYGVLYKPYDFDPNRKYPVIHWLVGGDSRTFTGGGIRRALAQLGFIVFSVDRISVGAFLVGTDMVGADVAALKQLAAKRPYMDLSRVGIEGGS